MYNHNYVLCISISIKAVTVPFKKCPIIMTKLFYHHTWVKMQMLFHTEQQHLWIEIKSKTMSKVEFDRTRKENYLFKSSCMHTSLRHITRHTFNISAKMMEVGNVWRNSFINHDVKCTLDLRPIIFIVSLRRYSFS